MASVTVTVEDFNDDIKVSIKSSDPELPLRSDIRSTDADLTPAQAAVFEMIELYMVANGVQEADEEQQAETERPKKCCGGGGCKRKEKAQGGDSACKRQPPPQEEKPEA